MARICYPGGPAIRCWKREDGSLYAESPSATELHASEVLLQSAIANSTDLFCTNTIADCTLRMQLNLSDFSIGEYIYYRENDVYFVPVPWDASSIYFVSGYELNSLNSRSINNPEGLIGNLGVYSFQIYLFIVLIFIFSSSLIALKALILFEINFSRRKKGRIDKFLQIMRKLRLEMFKSSCKHVKCCSFITYLTFFLFSTPFLLMFKTAQVITQPPPIYSSYQELIRSNVTIYYASMLTDEKAFLHPNSFNIERHDIVDKMWKYFLGHSRHIDLRKSQSEFLKLTHLLTSGYAVFFSSFYTSARIRQVFCSLSDSNQLFNVLMFRDKSQRMDLAGFAMRKGYKNEKLIKNQRRVFEFYFVRHMRRSFSSLYGLDIMGTDSEHRKLQKEICMKQEIIKQAVSLGSSGLEFFFRFFQIILAFVLFSLIVFFYEKFICPKFKFT